jgi:hypothetical protein
VHVQLPLQLLYIVDWQFESTLLMQRVLFRCGLQFCGDVHAVVWDLYQNSAFFVQQRRRLVPHVSSEVPVACAAVLLRIQHVCAWKTALDSAITQWVGPVPVNETPRIGPFCDV